jgi:hypothetical protein
MPGKVNERKQIGKSVIDGCKPIKKGWLLIAFEVFIGGWVKPTTYKIEQIGGFRFVAPTLQLIDKN